MNKFIPLSVPSLIGNELKYVTETIESGWVSSAGGYVKKFEQAVAKYVKVSDAVACQSGTAGLHLALKALDINKDNEVIVPTLTFIAAVNPVRYVGAEPIFMDCDDSLCMDADKLEKFCLEECTYDNGKLFNNITGKHIKAIIVVHVFGNMADMVRLKEISEKYGLSVIEDATEALGTYYTSGLLKGKFAGIIGDIGVYSFNGNKIITTGGGGMVVSDNEELLKKVKYLSTQAKSDELYYIHDEIGYNYRMTNVQAAIGLAQLEQLEEYIKIKNDNYSFYKNQINQLEGLSLLSFKNNIRSNKWFYSLFCADDYRMNRDDLINYFSSKNIQTRPIWGLIHRQKPYKDNQKYFIKQAYYYYNHIVNVPCSVSLTSDDIQYVVNML